MILDYAMHWLHLIIAYLCQCHNDTYVSFIQVPSYYVISPKSLFAWEFMLRLNSNVMSPPTVPYIVYTIVHYSEIKWLITLT